MTGANTGLGYWTVHHLVSKGGHVVMACRSQDKCKAAAASIKKGLESQNKIGTMDCIQLDLGSLASVEEFAKSFKEK